MPSIQQIRLSSIFANRFSGRQDYIAVQHSDQEKTYFRPKQIQPGSIKTTIASHIAQESCYGFYLLDEDNKIKCSCLDLDNHSDEADVAKRLVEERKRILEYLKKSGIPYLIEVSQSGTGVHIWAFSQSMEAVYMRRIWQHVLNETKVECEIYPRQDKHPKGGKGFGNLVRYPLWNKSTFVDDDMNPIDPCVALESSRVMRTSDIARLINKWQCDTTPQESAGPDDYKIEEGEESSYLKKALAKSLKLRKRWEGDGSDLDDDSKSALMQSVADLLVKSHMPTEHVKNSLVQWCDDNEYPKGKTGGRIDRCIKKAYDWNIDLGKPKAARTVNGLSMVENRIQLVKTGESFTFYTTGSKHIDKGLKGGICGGEYAIVVATPGTGKTCFGMQICLANASKGVPSLFVSCEMTERMFARRMSLMIGCDPSSEDDLLHAKEEKESTLKNMSAIFGTRQLDEVLSRVSEDIEGRDTKVVVVDYLQLISGGLKQGTIEDLDSIVHGLCDITRAHEDCCLIVLAQVNRAGDDNVSMRNIKGSSSAEQTADIVIGMQDVPPATLDPEGIRVMIKYEKNRNWGRMPNNIVFYDKSKQLIGVNDYVVTSDQSW